MPPIYCDVACGRHSKGTVGMKRVAVVAAMLALTILPAQAQMGGGGGGRRHQGDDKNEQKKPVVDEKAYKDALKRIPEPTTKYDPWGAAHASEADKKAK